jgi:hypothetical protein
LDETNVIVPATEIQCRATLEAHKGARGPLAASYRLQQNG